MMKSRFVLITVFLVLIIWQVVNADEQKTSDPLSIQMRSSNALSGVSGDFVTVEAEITNNSPHAIKDVTTYLSLVDTENKLPVDLEDWSAEKGLFIGWIEAGQVMPLLWKVHFVKAGTYMLTIIAIEVNNPKPITSMMTEFIVAPKINLNPGQVLPVALATPLVVLIMMAVLQYVRRRKSNN